MGNGTDKNNQTPSAELYAEIDKRKDWFFECQLRRLYFEAFRDVEENDPKTESLLNLISETDPSNAPLGSKKEKESRAYLDSQQPVWTREEREQRGAFKDITIGRGLGNWLDYKTPVKLAENLAKLKKLYEESKFSSNMDDIQEKNFPFLKLNNYGREDPSINAKDPKDQDKLPHAISRVAITEKKPWLIPEIFFNRSNPETPEEIAKSEVEKWIENGELFIRNYENELNEVLGGSKSPTFNLGKPDDYRGWIKGMLEKLLTPKSADAIKVEFIDQSSETWLFNIKIKTPSYSLNELKNYSSSDSVKYWINSCNNALKEIYVNKSESDMGLCLIMRTLYLYGTLPLNLDIRWRNRQPPNPNFHHFFAMKAKMIWEIPSYKDNPDLQDRLLTVQTKLQILLEETAASPHSGAIHFSPLAQEIIKQDILGYKFWLDEPYHAYDYHKEDHDVKNPQGINRAKNDNGLGGDDGKKLFSEMEYWSENHYIMFASSEYLAGQLWQDKSFQPARDFLKPEDKDKKGVLTGKQRMERGKARILKWLNNRLLFGWTEFNSSGYYREHLWALLNLVDFAGDEEVRKKATIVTDLLLFDVTRFLHKGNMGACGGRSQFPSKNNGWDNALGDVVEIMLGTRGIFIESGGEIGCSFATSTCKTPAVLLEIGCFPPKVAFVDRSRVSISFDEAPKYGIQYSQKSDQKDSLEEGFAPKRKKHFEALGNVNKAIEISHTGYGQMEDDTVFWWSLSAYYNKQVVRNTFTCVDTFKLEKNKAFDTLKSVVNWLAGFIKVKDVLLGTLPVVGGIFLNDVFSNYLENASDELTIFLDGSTRSRANIYTYRNRDVMLSSIQNFRTGQLNIQSHVNQATISTEINVFTTSGFPGLSISDLPFAIGGALVGALGVYTLGFAAAGGAIAGGAIAGGLNEFKIEGENPFGDQGDGPGWWTGYWALPMVVQHESAAIIAYDFHTMQVKLTDVGSHVWFLKNAFDLFEKRRSSAYVDENFVLVDIIGILPNVGPRGYWIFGKKLHKKDPQNPDADEEGYIGVFSNKEPEWQDKDSDFYSAQVKEKNEENEEKLEGIKDKIAEINDSIDDRRSRENNEKIEQIKSLFKEAENHQRTWANPLSVDYFADKDWYVDGKNIWIIQVGNKKDYGSFDNFKEQVSRAKVELDDVGDMECVYHIPKPDGGSQALSLKYKGEIKLDGSPFQTDCYPRFENHHFIRGGRVEWGQREYVIEYNGKSLKHDFSNLENPKRDEDDIPTPEEADTIKGLVIYLKTEDEEMDLFSVAQATVKVGCEILASDEIVAAGEVEEDTAHDAEWIFFDKPGLLTPDMTIEIKHPPTSKGDDDPEWKMSFSLKALLGDRRLYDCSISFPGCHFEDERRSTGQIPFTVQVSRWRTWQIFEDMGRFISWQIASQPGWEPFYYDYLNLLAIDNNKRLWHKRLEACPGPNSDWKAVGTTGQSLFFAELISVCSISTQPNNLFLFAMNKGELFNCFAWPSEDFSKKQWTKLTVETIPTAIFGLPIPNAAPVPVALSQQTRIVAKVSADWQGGVDLYLLGADHNFYSHLAWLPGSTKTWRQIATDAVFTPLAGAAFEVCADYLFVLDDRQRLWVGPINNSDLKMTPSWKQLSDDQTKINNFSVAQKGKALTILINANQGEIRASGYTSIDDPVIWERVGAGINFRTFAKAKLAWAFPREGHLDIFTTGTDGKIYRTYWNAQQGWEIDHSWNVIDPKGHQFENPESGDLVVLNRVNNQLEIFTSSRDNKMWKTWWS